MYNMKRNDIMCVKIAEIKITIGHEQDFLASMGEHTSDRMIA